MCEIPLCVIGSASVGEVEWVLTADAAPGCSGMASPAICRFIIARTFAKWSPSSRKAKDDLFLDLDFKCLPIPLLQTVY